MKVKKCVVNGAVMGLTFPILFYFLNLDKLPLVELLGIMIAIGLVVGLLLRGVSKLLSKPKSV